MAIVYRNLTAYFVICLAGLRRLSMAVSRFAVLSVRKRRMRFWGLLTAVLLFCLLAGRVSDAYLDQATLVRANTIHRHAVAASDLGEKALLVDIVDQLSTGLKDSYRAQIGPIIVDEARNYGFDPLLLVAIIMTESSFGRTEISHMGARGLMQVKPSVAKAVALRNGLGWRHADQLFDPAYNVRLGTRYLFELVVQFRDVKKAIIAYNYGETALRWRIRTGQKLPTAYFRRVKNNYNMLRERFGEDVPWEAMQFDMPLR